MHESASLSRTIKVGIIGRFPRTVFPSVTYTKIWNAAKILRVEVKLAEREKEARNERLHSVMDSTKKKGRKTSKNAGEFHNRAWCQASALPPQLVERSLSKHLAKGPGFDSQFSTFLFFLQFPLFLFFLSPSFTSL
jgi:hypothetical protein